MTTAATRKLAACAAVKRTFSSHRRRITSPFRTLRYDTSTTLWPWEILTSWIFSWPSRTVVCHHVCVFFSVPRHIELIKRVTWIHVFTRHAHRVCVGVYACYGKHGARCVERDASIVITESIMIHHAQRRRSLSRSNSNRSTARTASALSLLKAHLAYLLHENSTPQY